MILDNLLKQADYEHLKKEMLGEYFPWYWNDFVNDSDENLGGFQLTHTFCNNDTPQSSAYPLMVNIMNAFTERTSLRIKSVYRIKANLNVRDSLRHLLIEDLKHTDMDDNKWITLLYYLNDSDGTTVFDDKEITPKGNSLVVFRSNTEHAGNCPKIHKRKVVINFIVELIK